jgi:hypothetical protein
MYTFIFSAKFHSTLFATVHALGRDLPPSL